MMMHLGQRSARILFTVSILMLVAGSPAHAQKPTISVNGGGTASFGADLDGDGQIDGSQFGIGVNIYQDGSARGHFICLMAGRSHFLGLPVMLVAGKVNSGWLNNDGSVTFTGIGSVNLGNGSKVTDVPFEVTVTAGGPGVGTMILTVIHPDFDGAPGDTAPGNGQYNLPLETVTSGQIGIR